MKKKPKYLALCSSFNDKENKKQYGVLLFTRNSDNNSEVVSHEICHATNYWFRSVYKKPNIFKNGKHDEEFASILGYMVSQYWGCWYNLPKKWKK